MPRLDSTPHAGGPAPFLPIPSQWSSSTTCGTTDGASRLLVGGFAVQQAARVKGSHHQFKHPTPPGLVTVKHPDGDIPKGRLDNIRKQAGWK